MNIDRSVIEYVKSLSKDELIVFFLHVRQRFKTDFKINITDNYAWRIHNAACLINHSVDTSFHVFGVRPTVKNPADYGNSRTNLGEAKSGKTKKTKSGKYSDKKAFEFINQNMPDVQQKTLNHESFMFSLHDEEFDKIVFIAYCNSDVSVNHVKSILKKEQLSCSKKYSNDRKSYKRPSIWLKISDVINIEDVIFIDSEGNRVDKNFILNRLKWTVDNNFFAV